MKSDVRGSWVSLIRRCSNLMMSRCKEFSTRVSNSTNSEICNYWIYLRWPEDTIPENIFHVEKLGQRIRWSIHDKIYSWRRWHWLQMYFRDSIDLSPGILICKWDHRWPRGRSLSTGKGQSERVCRVGCFLRRLGGNVLLLEKGHLQWYYLVGASMIVRYRTEKSVDTY